MVARASSLQPPIAPIVAAFLTEVDADQPGLIEGLYLVGSAALGEFRPQRSDIDFIAVAATPPDSAQMAVLETIHSRLQQRWKRPFFDGLYITWSELADDPARARPGASAHEGRLLRNDQWDRNPIAWETLAQCGIRCRGPAIDELRIWRDPEVLAAWTNANLDSYWRGLIERGRRIFSRAGLFGLSEYACEWCVLGISRLHYTLATGIITSKEGAGIYARETFPIRWHRVIEEALRIRRASGKRSLYQFAFARRLDLLAFCEMAIADAHRVYEQRRA